MLADLRYVAVSGSRKVKGPFLLLLFVCLLLLVFVCLFVVVFQ